MRYEFKNAKVVYDDDKGLDITLENGRTVRLREHRDMARAMEHATLLEKQS